MSSIDPREPSNSRDAALPCRISDETDTVLVGCIARGEENALGALYDRWVDRVYMIAMSVLNDADDAEDVVERTFTQIWGEASRYHNGRGKVGTWILLIARSRALDLQRQLRKRRLRDSRLDELPTEVAEGRPSPLHSAESLDQRELVADAVNALPLDQQKVVRLTFFSGLNQREIASELGVPLGTVKTRIRLAIKKLRASLTSLREGGG